MWNDAAVLLVVFASLLVVVAAWWLLSLAIVGCEWIYRIWFSENPHQEKSMFQQIAIQMLIKAALCVLGLCKDCCPSDAKDDCIDGVCEAEATDRKLNATGTKFVSFDLIKCIDIPRLIAALREVLAVINDARMCVEDDDKQTVITLSAAPDPKEG